MKHNVVVILTILSISALAFFEYGTPYFWLLSLLVLLFFIVILVFGTLKINLNYFIDSINKGNEKGVSLTFDDGPDFELTPKILSVLDKFQVKATFFLIGEKVENHPEIVQEIIKKGHIIGSHSFHHTNDIPLMSTKKLDIEIRKGVEAIKKATQVDALYFRPPFGITTPRYRRVLKKNGLVSIGWNIRSFDTLAKTKDQLFTAIIKKIKPGSIILLHDNCKLTLAVLPDFLTFCNDKGIKIVSLDENINIKPYQSV